MINRKKAALTIFTVIIVLLVITSCRTFQVGGMEVHETATQGEIVGDFNIAVSVNKFLGNSGGVNLFNATSDATDPLIIQAIRTEVQNRGGTSAVNVKIEYKATFLNILLNTITFNIWAPSTAIVTGTIIR